MLKPPPIQPEPFWRRVRPGAFDERFEIDFGKGRIAHHARKGDTVRLGVENLWSSGKRVSSDTGGELHPGFEWSLGTASCFFAWTRFPASGVFVIAGDVRYTFVPSEPAGILVSDFAGQPIVEIIPPWRDSMIDQGCPGTIPRMAPTLPWPDLGLVAAMSLELLISFRHQYSALTLVRIGAVGRAEIDLPV